MIVIIGRMLLGIPLLALQLLSALPDEGWRCLWKRIPLFLVFWLLHTLLTILHIIGHLLDEVLFPRYRQVKVNNPLFILGLPRSGTTFLQRLLSQDDSFTTFTTWEAILAPSLTEKYFYRALGAFLKPLGKILARAVHGGFRRMDTIHAIRLNEPEEDFLLLLPLQSCLLLAFLMPGSPHFWRLTRFDKSLPASFKKPVLDYYHRCLKKHLCFHGRDRRLLSKNPSFTSWAHDLFEIFPDARMVSCTRPPAEVIPSQLSSLRPAMQLLGQTRLSPVAQQQMIESLHYYYFLLGDYQQNDRIILISMKQLQSDLESAVSTLYAFLELECSGHMRQVLQREVNKSRAYSSAHHYSLEEFSLSDKQVTDSFSDVWPLAHGQATVREAGDN